MIHRFWMMKIQKGYFFSNRGFLSKKLRNVFAARAFKGKLGDSPPGWCYQLDWCSLVSSVASTQLAGEEDHQGRGSYCLTRNGD